MSALDVAAIIVIVATAIFILGSASIMLIEMMITAIRTRDWDDVWLLTLVVLCLLTFLAFMYLEQRLQ